MLASTMTQAARKEKLWAVAEVEGRLAEACQQLSATTHALNMAEDNVQVQVLCLLHQCLSPAGHASASCRTLCIHWLHFHQLVEC